MLERQGRETLHWLSLSARIQDNARSESLFEMIVLKLCLSYLSCSCIWIGWLDLLHGI